jgi:hypothetical protein
MGDKTTAATARRQKSIRNFDPYATVAGSGYGGELDMSGGDVKDMLAQGGGTMFDDMDALENAEKQKTRVYGKEDAAMFSLEFLRTAPDPGDKLEMLTSWTSFFLNKPELESKGKAAWMKNASRQGFAKVNQLFTAMTDSRTSEEDLLKDVLHDNAHIKQKIVSGVAYQPTAMETTAFRTMLMGGKTPGTSRASVLTEKEMSDIDNWANGPGGGNATFTQRDFQGTGIGELSSQRMRESGKSSKFGNKANMIYTAMRMTKMPEATVKKYITLLLYNELTVKPVLDSYHMLKRAMSNPEMVRIAGEVISASMDLNAKQIEESVQEVAEGTRMDEEDIKQTMQTLLVALDPKATYVTMVEKQLLSVHYGRVDGVLASVADSWGDAWQAIGGSFNANDMRQMGRSFMGDNNDGWDPDWYYGPKGDGKASFAFKLAKANDLYLVKLWSEFYRLTLELQSSLRRSSSLGRVPLGTLSNVRKYVNHSPAANAARKKYKMNLGGDPNNYCGDVNKIPVFTDDKGVRLQEGTPRFYKMLKAGKVTKKCIVDPSMYYNGLDDYEFS